MAPAIIAAVITAAVSATEIGLQASGALQPARQKIDANPPLNKQQNSQQAAVVGQQLPNLQSLTGGSLSPEYYAQFGGTSTGLENDPRATGNIQEAINKYFGISAPGDTGLSSGVSGGPGIASLTGAPPPSSGGTPGGGILDMLKNSGGGNPGVRNWVASVLNGNNFQGLQA